MPKLKIPSPISGGLLLSYRCTATCRHCMYGCSPQWPGDWISEKTLQECLVRLAPHIQPSPYGERGISLNHGLHFTGGEPFLNFRLLLRAVQMAHALGIPSLFVETNAYWSTEDEDTWIRLKALKRAGLNGILISVNPFYAEYVPFERTERCIWFSREIFGWNVLVYQAEYYERFKEMGIRKRIPLEEYVKLDPDLTRKAELFLTGRAAHRLRDFYPAYPARLFFQESCRSLLIRNWHNHFDNYGNFIPGYCGGIALGSWKEIHRLMQKGIDLQAHPVLKFLIEENLEGLFHFAQGFGYRESTGGYISKCALCVDLRRHLASLGGFPELTPKEFYRQIV